MRPRVFVTMFLTLLAAACVRQERFRFVPATTACFGDSASGPQVNGPADQKPSLDCRHQRYSTAFIEFDSDGKMFDANQEAAALKLLERRKADAPGGKIITVVYVHGWKNNAAEAPPGGKPKDVEKFQSALLELGYRAEKAKPDVKALAVPVVGIYIGWRGKTLMGPDWFTFLSLWGRRGTANRIGSGPDLATVLNRIIETTNAGSTTSRVVMVGHSFGARVLEHAIEGKKIQLYDAAPDIGSVAPRVDLVLYVNSANDARLSMARVQELRAHPLKVHHPDYRPEDCGDVPEDSPEARDETRAAKCREYPLLVAITSKGDLATKYLLPAANTINLDSHSAPPVTPPAGEFADPTPSAGTISHSAAGHLAFLQSHVAREVTCPVVFAPAGEKEQAPTTEQPKKDEQAAARAMQAEDRKRFDRAMHPVCDAADKNCRFVFRTLGDQPTCYQVDQRTAGTGKPPFNNTAFWILAVEPTVIKDHGDIWNLSFVEMLGQLMAPRGFFEPGSGRIKLSAAPATQGTK
jgi:hypothetical protein